MPPEQIRGDRVTPRSDIYSLGILIYECLSGRPPFTRGDLAHQHLKVEPKPLEHIPADFQAIVEKCLEKDPEHRYATCRELVNELDEFLHRK